MGAVPYWRLSGFYFFYFAFVGAMAPYWSLYLKSLAFDALAIGVLMSLLQVTRIFAPNIWGHIADRTGRRAAIVRIAAVGSLVTYLGVFFGTSFWWLFAVMVAMSFFWSASLPLVEATTLAHLGDRPHDYGLIRLWGSIGFIATVVGLGAALDTQPIRLMLWVVLAMLAGVALFAYAMPDAPATAHSTDRDPVWTIVRRPEVAALIAACFLMAAAHGPYYTFYSIWLVDHGYTKTAVGWLWALGVIVEIGVFLAAPRIFSRFSLETVFLASFAAAATRFLMIAWGVDSVGVIVLAQTLHAMTFGTYHASAIALVHRFFKGRHQAKGQGIYNSVAFGAGGTLGGLYSGFTWDRLGGAATFSIAAAFAGVALVIVAFKLRPAAVP